MSARSECRAIYLKPAHQQFSAEIMIAGDFNSRQFVPVAPLNVIRDDLFRDLRLLSLALDFLGFRRVINSRVKVSIALEPLPEIPLSFLQKVCIHGPFLIDRDKPLQLSL